MKKEYSIINGPSKFVLFNTFPDKSDGHRRSVRFDIKAESSKWSDVHVVINNISWEDGSAESWCFEGFVTRFGWLPKGNATGQRVSGYFRTDRRNCGCLKVLDEHDPLN